MMVPCMVCRSIETSGGNIERIGILRGPSLCTIIEKAGQCRRTEPQDCPWCGQSMYSDCKEDFKCLGADSKHLVHGCRACGGTGVWEIGAPGGTSLRAMALRREKPNARRYWGPSDTDDYLRRERAAVTGGRE